jgi:DNA-binding FadR family transcriptional regulator
MMNRLVVRGFREHVQKESVAMKRVESRGLHEGVIEEVGRRIILGEFAPGIALPSEAELCKALAVSRTALREALRVLSAKGLLEAKRKIGTVVRPAECWNYLDADILSWQLASRDAERVIGELYELRHLIEPIAASLAAKNANAPSISELRDAYREMELAGDDGERIKAPDMRFHRAIIEASGNRLFSSLSHVVGAALAVSFDLVSAAPRGQKHSMPAHRRVLEAIATRDAAGARLAMQKLIEGSQRDALAVRRARGARKGAQSNLA